LSSTGARRTRFAEARFIIARDRRRRFRLAHLQSLADQALLEQHGLSATEFTLVILIVGGEAHMKSSAVLRIAARLDGAWPLAAAFLAVPRILRDAAYDFVGSRRYRWFGRQASCPVPTPADAARFLR
jgi:predicted DCC family thiol-disulfide oxidoreductase YuxK